MKKKPQVKKPTKKCNPKVDLPSDEKPKVKKPSKKCKVHESNSEVDNPADSPAPDENQPAAAVIIPSSVLEEADLMFQQERW